MLQEDSVKVMCNLLELAAGTLLLESIDKMFKHLCCMLDMMHLSLHILPVDA